MFMFTLDRRVCICVRWCVLCVHSRVRAPARISVSLDAHIGRNAIGSYRELRAILNCKLILFVDKVEVSHTHIQTKTNTRIHVSERATIDYFVCCPQSHRFGRGRTKKFSFLLATHTQTHTHSHVCAHFSRALVRRPRRYPPVTRRSPPARLPNMC